MLGGRPQAGLALACMDEELVLHRAPLAARVEIVVDAGPSVVEAGLERGHDPIDKPLGRNDLSGALRPAASSSSRAGVSSPERGSTPSRAAKKSSS